MLLAATREWVGKANRVGFEAVNDGTFASFLLHLEQFERVGSSDVAGAANDAIVRLAERVG